MASISTFHRHSVHTSGRLVRRAWTFSPVRQTTVDQPQHVIHSIDTLRTPVIGASKRTGTIHIDDGPARSESPQDRVPQLGDRVTIRETFKHAASREPHSMSARSTVDDDGSQRTTIAIVERAAVGGRDHVGGVGLGHVQQRGDVSDVAARLAEHVVPCRGTNREMERWDDPRAVISRAPLSGWRPSRIRVNAARSTVPLNRWNAAPQPTQRGPPVSRRNSGLARPLPRWRTTRRQGRQPTFEIVNDGSRDRRDRP